MGNATMLDVRALNVDYGKGEARVHAVRDVSFSIAPGEAYGLIGESGSGKTTVAYSVIRHLQGASLRAERLTLEGRDLLTMDAAALRQLRGRQVAMVYQDPMNALNPMINIGEQIAEALRFHLGESRQQAWTHAVELLDQVRMPEPELIARRYPHQISGGQQQRAIIAMALSCKPKLLIMDEPTTGLDVTTEAVILDLVNDLRASTGASILFISHNLAVVSKVCDRVGVLYAGELVEEGSAEDVLHRSRHLYSRGLLNALPTVGSGRRRLRAMRGRLPDLRVVPEGCIFRPRCDFAVAECATVRPLLQAVTPLHRAACHRATEALDLPAEPEVAQAAQTRQGEGARLRLQGLRKVFVQPRGLPFLSRPNRLVAVGDVSLEIPAGRTLAVVGESGSGKTTLARCIAGLLQPDGGEVVLEGRRLPAQVGRRRAEDQRAVQYVFQNPDASLNPFRTVEDIVARPLRLYGLARGAAIRARVLELLDAVKMGDRYLARFPHELSGGEKQRVSIARAFAAEPSLVICDEPTSALDVSVQAAVLNQLVDLQHRFGTSYLFVSHDLSVVRYIADTVAIMSRGEVVETGETARVFENPQHPYTRRLLETAPRIIPQGARPAALGLTAAGTGTGY